MFNEKISHIIVTSFFIRYSDSFWINFVIIGIKIFALLFFSPLYYVQFLLSWLIVTVDVSFTLKLQNQF
jgi:hypothetical protein